MRFSLFRLLNASLPSAVLLAILFHWLRKVKEATSPTSAWGLSKPPPCATLEHEFARFNEFLAYPQFLCKNVLRIGDASLQFPLCIGSPYGIDLNRTGFFMVSLTNNQDGLAFERAVLQQNAAAEVLAYSSSRHAHLRATSKIQLVGRVLIPRGLRGRKSFSISKHETVDQFLARLSSRQVVDVLKVDCTMCWFPEAQLQFLRDLVECGALSKVRILILVIRMNERNSHLLRDWYEALTSMFFENSMAVYVAKQSGDCSIPSASCKYTVGLVNVGGIIQTLVRAPVAGLGSVQEELLRLHYFLNGPKYDCMSEVFPVTNESCYGCEPWKTCSPSTYDDKCAVLYFGFAGSSECTKAYSLLGGSRCAVYIFDPFCSQHINGILNLRFFNLSVVNYSPNQVLTLLPSDVIIDKIFVDLQGSEWDLLGDLLISEPFKLTRQVLLRINLWTGEEAENIRRMFGWLYFHVKAGWQLFDVEQRQEWCEKFSPDCRQRAYLQVGMTKG